MELSPKQKSLISYHNAGFIPIPLRAGKDGKIPAVKNWQQARYDLTLDLEQYPNNFGIVLQDDQLVIDVDPRNFPKNDKVFARLSQDFKLDQIPDRVIVRTGSGGYHLYFKKPATVPVRETFADYPGIEFKSKGRQVVGVGSAHPDTGEIYELRSGDFSKCPPLPEDLLAFISAAPKNGKKHEAATEKYPDRAADCARFISYLENAEIAVEGEQGDRQTYVVSCEARNLHLSPQKCFELMDAHYNPRCRPPWSESELKMKVQNAYRYAQGAPGEKTPEKDFPPLTKTPLWSFDRSNGKLAKTMNNVVGLFHTLGAKNPLFDSLAFCEFSGQVMKMKLMPWEGGEHKQPRQWTDGDSIRLRRFLGSDSNGTGQPKVDFPTKLIDEAVYDIACARLIHPVRDYLNGLRWDGIHRIGSWLVDYCGTENTAYTREVGKKTLIQLVARAYHPGCRADHVLILEGAQGIGKSTVVRTLGGEFYADIVIDAHDRDTVDAMRGAWVIEFSEMEVTRRAEAQALKAFITRTTDKCRLAYGKRSINYPRTCGFIGTINPDATGEYLSDSTGGRRFWPVLCGMIQMGDLAKDRDQLFAEAVECYKRGESYHIEDPKVLKEALIEQAKRQSSEPWKDSIAEYLQTNDLNLKYGLVAVKDVWLYGLRGSETGFNKAHAHKIGNVLRDLGYRYETYWNPAARSYMKMFRKLENPFDRKPELDADLDLIFS